MVADGIVGLTLSVDGTGCNHKHLMDGIDRRGGRVEWWSFDGWWCNSGCQNPSPSSSACMHGCIKFVGARRIDIADGAVIILPARRAINVLIYMCWDAAGNTTFPKQIFDGSHGEDGHV